LCLIFGPAFIPGAHAPGYTMSPLCGSRKAASGCIGRCERRNKNEILMQANRANSGPTLQHPTRQVPPPEVLTLQRSALPGVPDGLPPSERHVARPEVLTGMRLRSKIYWVRGLLLGRGRMACRGLALGSDRSPNDWDTADHPDRLSVDRHELAHAVLHQRLAPDSDPPTLLSEGWAESQAGTTGRTMIPCLWGANS